MIKMINKDDRIRVREQNRDVLEEISRNQDDIITRRLDEIRKRHAGIEEKIRDLQEQRAQLLETPILRKEFLEVAKERLRTTREDFLESRFLPHLEGCHKKGAYPFGGADMRVRVLPEAHLWKLFAFALSEKDLEVLVNMLPDEGIPSAERDAKIMEIEAEIARLAKIVEDELAELSK